MSTIKRWCWECGTMQEIEIKEWDWWTRVEKWICPRCKQEKEGRKDHEQDKPQE